MTTSAPETVLPPHLEQAPSVPTAPEEKPAPAPKRHRLRPVHLRVLDRAQADAMKIIREAQELIASDLGAVGEYRLAPDPSGAVFLVEQAP